MNIASLTLLNGACLVLHAVKGLLCTECIVQLHHVLTINFVWRTMPLTSQWRSSRHLPTFDSAHYIYEGH